VWFFFIGDSPDQTGSQIMTLDCGPCVIRSWEQRDLEAIVRHANNRQVWLQLRDRFPHPYTVADAQAWLRYVSETTPDSNFAIDLDGEAIGGIGLILGSDIERRSAEIGYWLGQDVWGRGLGTAALRAMTTYAFAAYNLCRIFAVPFADNLASRRILEKAGYVLEGILRCSAMKAGRVLDQAMYAIVSEEHMKGRGTEIP
jgi:RimJ/RimL family protein N-acetyltransferase